MFAINLPNEVILLIVDQLSGPDLASLHAVSKCLFALTDHEYLRRLFRQSTIAISSRSLDRLSAIAASSRLRPHVHSLRILCVHAPPAPGPDDQELIDSLGPQMRQNVLWWDTPECRALYNDQSALLSAGKAVTCLVKALGQLSACHTIDLVRDRMYDFHDELNMLQSLEDGWRWRDRARDVYPPRPLLRRSGKQRTLIQKMVGTVMEAIRLSSQEIKHLRVDALLGFSHVLANPIAPVAGGGGADEEEKDDSSYRVQSHTRQWNNATRDSALQLSISLPSLTELDLCLSRARYSPGLGDLTLTDTTLSDILGHFGALKYLCIDISNSYKLSSFYPSFSRAQLGPTVSHLKLCSLGVAADDLICLLQQHPQLRHLCLSRVLCKPVSAPTIWHAFLGALRDLVNPEMQFLEIKACSLRTAVRGVVQDVSLLWETDEKMRGQQGRSAGASDCDCYYEHERLCEKCLDGLKDSIIIRPLSSPWSSDSIKVFNETSASRHYRHRGCERQLRSQTDESTTSGNARVENEEDPKAAQNLNQTDKSPQPQSQREIRSTTTTTIDETENRATFAQSVNEALRRLRLEYEPMLRTDVGAAQRIHSKPFPIHELRETEQDDVERRIVARWARTTSSAVLRSA